MTRKRPSSSATLSSSTRTVPECATRFARRPCAGSGPDAGIDGEFAMKNLDGDPVRVAQMGRRVYASHPAYAEQTVEAVLATKDHADARPRSGKSFSSDWITTTSCPSSEWSSFPRRNRHFAKRDLEGREWAWR